jgi:DNA adenine methylase
MKSAPVLKYPGSKWKIADWIISHFPPHTTYLEPFFGSGAVFFTKKPSKVETINDIDGNVVNLFQVIREQPEELARLIEFTPWARDEYYASYEPIDDPLEKARRFLVKCWQGYGTDLSHKVGWNNTKRGSLRVSKNNEFQKLPQNILHTAERLKHAQIENRPALELIQEYNYPEVLIYADPPYIFDTRSGGKRYENEMIEEEYIELLEALKQHKGPVILSGYQSDLYDRILQDWDKEVIETIAVSGGQRQEVIWMNFDNPNISLFD